MSNALATFRAFLVSALFVFAASTAHAERRVALVVGNGAYVHATRLANPTNDARDIGQKLERLGFDVIQSLDVGSDAFDGAVSAFSKKLPGADVALFFYAGHGLQFNGFNYLLPVDSKIEGEYALRRKSILADEVIELMEKSATVSLVFLDACRNNTLLRDLEQSLPEQSRSAAGQRGLARMDPRGTNTLIAFATAPNDVAADGTGRNSPFSTALLRHIETTNTSIQDMLTSVAADVLRDTNQRQRPEVLSRLSTRIVLNFKAEPPPPPPVVASKEREASIAWDAIKETCEMERLDAFKARYGDTFFGDLAKRRAELLDSKAICAAVAQPPAAPNPPVLSQSPKQAIEDEGFVRTLQAELKRVGCFAGPIDGKWGDMSKSSLRDYSKRASITIDENEPTSALIAQIALSKERVCPLKCGESEVVKDGKCVVLQKSTASEVPVKPMTRSPQASGGGSFVGVWSGMIENYTDPKYGTYRQVVITSVDAAGQAFGSWNTKSTREAAAMSLKDGVLTVRTGYSNVVSLRVTAPNALSGTFFHRNSQKHYTIKLLKQGG